MGCKFRILGYGGTDVLNLTFARRLQQSQRKGYECLVSIVCAQHEVLTNLLSLFLSDLQMRCENFEQHDDVASRSVDSVIAVSDVSGQKHLLQHRFELRLFIARELGRVAHDATCLDFRVDLSWL